MCFTWWWRYCAWLLSLKQEKKNRQLRKKKKLKQTQGLLATLLVLEGTHIPYSILNNQKCLRTHFKVDFCLFCIVLAANLFKYGRKRWVSWFKVTYLNMLTCFFLSQRQYLMLRSKEIVYFKCRAQPQITKRLWTAEICILCGHRCC